MLVSSGVRFGLVMVGQFGSAWGVWSAITSVVVMGSRLLICAFRFLLLASCFMFRPAQALTSSKFFKICVPLSGV
jgi:hypothetical protein